MKNSIDVSHVEGEFCFIEPSVQGMYIGWVAHGYRTLYFVNVGGKIFISVFRNIIVFDRRGVSYHFDPDYSITCKSVKTKRVFPSK